MDVARLRVWIVCLLFCVLVGVGRVEGGEWVCCTLVTLSWWVNKGLLGNIAVVVVDDGFARVLSSFRGWKGFLKRVQKKEKNELLIYELKTWLMQLVNNS